VPAFDFILRVVHERFQCFGQLLYNCVVVVKFFDNKQRSLTTLERRSDFLLQLDLLIIETYALMLNLCTHVSFTFE